jgi:uncharacterized Fe-S center protein
MKPVNFNKERDARKAVAIQQLKDIRTLEVAYKTVTGHFTADLDSLKDFYLKGQMPIIMQVGSADDSLAWAHTEAVKKAFKGKMTGMDLFKLYQAGDKNLVFSVENKIPVKDTKWIQYDIVGSHVQNYDFMINLAHFKGHAMGGFGGVLKNASIGVASSNGKVNIHSAGKHEKAEASGDLHAPAGWFLSPEKNTPFIESMAAAAQAVHDYYKGNVIYIDVMNNISIDCDCDGNPHEPTIKDIGIAASLDPVALDKFCIDQVFSIPSGDGNDTIALIDRINQRHGIRILYRAEENGLGSTSYKVVEIN